MKKIQSLLLALGFCLTLAAQKISIEEYVEMYKDIAMKEMVRSGVPASITLAQGILETENGNSALVKKSNNHFGIKCKETWTGPSVSHDDDAPQECFRKYENAFASYIDHSDFLRTRKHYHFLFDLDPLDYKAWAHGLKKAGYATNPKYPQILIKYIETYRLNDYSLMAMGKLPQTSSDLVKTDKPNESVSGVSRLQNDDEVVVIAVNNEAPRKPIQPVASSNEVKSVTKPELPVSKQETIAEIANSVAIIANPQKAVAVESKPADNYEKVDYPSGEFKINETRVVYAAQGTSLLSLATTYDLPLRYIYDFNDFSEEKELLEKSQLIFLQRKRRVGATDYHIVSYGETLYDIAQKQGIRMEALLQLNQLSNNQVPAIGEKLYLQNPAPNAPTLAGINNVGQQIDVSVENNEEEGYEVHVVQPKETLYGISKKYNVSMNELTLWNNLQSSELKEGMELIISQKDYNVFKSLR